MIKSPFKQRQFKDFKILMLYPNLHMSALMPQSIGIFTALLKEQGFKLDLFDCTYYKDIDSLTIGKNTNEEKVKNRNVTKYDNSEWHQKGVKPKDNIRENFKKKVLDFEPDLIIVSVLESTYFLAVELLKSIPENRRNFKTVFGGVFATYATDKIIKNQFVDYVCRGEGEGAVVELCQKLAQGKRIDNIQNFTIKGEPPTIFIKSSVSKGELANPVVGISTPLFNNNCKENNLSLDCVMAAALFKA
jgi:hypothetical protein